MLDEESLRQRVSSNGLTSVDRRIQLLALAMSPFLVSAFVFLTNGGLGASLLPKLILGLVLVGLGDLALTEALSVRRIDIGPEGLTFRYLLHSERGRWSELSPHKIVYPHGSYFGRRSWAIARSRSNESHRDHLLTRDQALAIIRYHKRPVWDFSGTRWADLVQESHISGVERVAVPGRVQ